jgi:hypothetical protein
VDWPKSTADMKEFTECITAAKDCLTSDGGGSLCFGMMERAMGSIGANAGFQIELACGPCTLGMNSNDWPSFSCKFESGSGCYWKTSSGTLQLKIVSTLWEKWTEYPQADYGYSFFQAHNGQYLDGDLTTSAGKGNSKRWSESSAGGDKIWLQNSNGKYLQDFEGVVKMSDTKGTALVRYYVSDSGATATGTSPHRFKVATDAECCGWTDRLSFYAYDVYQTGTTRYYVSDAGSPHRFKVATDAECCGWTDRLSFYAYDVYQTGTTRYYVSDAGPTHRFKVATDAGCCGWTDRLSFYAFADMEAWDTYKLERTTSSGAFSMEGVRDWEKWSKDGGGFVGDGVQKYYLKSHRNGYLSAPAGTYGCQICLTIDLSSAGMIVKICVGFDSGCWFFTEILGERVPPPAWSRTTGVTITITGYIKLCVAPFSVNGWVKLQVERGFCKRFLGFTVTFAIYGYLKFEIQWKSDGSGVTLIGTAAVGVSGGIYKPSWRRKKGRRRSKCSCNRVKSDGSMSDCPQKAGASGQLTFTLKMWPCQNGKDAKLTGTISFSLSLNLFGIKINLPKIPDIQLFSANLRKPFG